MIERARIWCRYVRLPVSREKNKELRKLGRSWEILVHSCEPAFICRDGLYAQHALIICETERRVGNTGTIVVVGCGPYIRVLHR
jgi:hypothetical protein